MQAQPFWPTLLQIVTCQDWGELVRHPAIGQHLSHRCLLCDLWFNRSQELHCHYRLHRSEQTTGCLSYGAQISKLLECASPCPLRNREFKRHHCCPVATQVGALAMISLNVEEKQRQVQHCMLCSMDLSSPGKLHQHLCQMHGMQIPDWCPPRDSHLSSDGCRHWGAIFDTRDGVRRHADAMTSIRVHLLRRLMFFKNGVAN